MNRTRTDELEIAVAMANLYAELNPDVVTTKNKAMSKSAIMNALLRDIRGTADFIERGYAHDMISYLERNIKSNQYTQFKACQKALREWGIV